MENIVMGAACFGWLLAGQNYVLRKDTLLKAC